jgi:hypothetical protein
MCRLSDAAEGRQFPQCVKIETSGFWQKKARTKADFMMQKIQEQLLEKLQCDIGQLVCLRQNRRASLLQNALLSKFC